MKLLLICGTHPRHRFIIDQMLKIFDELHIVLMEREPLINDSTDIQNTELRDIFEFHFNKRYEVESNIYGTIGMSELVNSLKSRINVLKVKPYELNDDKVIEFVQGCNANISIIMGAGLLGSKLLEVMPSNHVNIHLGLSPWYRGSGTLFWPSFNWEPWKSGTTFHRLNGYADSGGIIHQTLCKTSPDQGVHETAASAVIEAKKVLPKVIDWMIQNPKATGIKQPFVGRSYLSTQIKPEHLFDIHVLRGDNTLKILDERGIKGHKFKLYSAIE